MTTETQKPRKRLFDRLFISYGDEPKVLHSYPLCEVLDGRIQEISLEAVDMLEVNGNKKLYPMLDFIAIIKKQMGIVIDKEIVAMWLQQEGSKVKVQIL